MNSFEFPTCEYIRLDTVDIVTASPCTSATGTQDEEEILDG